MSRVVNKTYLTSQYRDYQFEGKSEDQEELLKRSTTLYVGNLSFFTTEEQIYELFSKCGELKRITMGLDRVKRTPCGFCFVEYIHRSDAENCMKYVNGTRLDDRVIRSDWDAGFREGRQYGRGRSGGQVRDEFREDFDAGRGGYGKIIEKSVRGAARPGLPGSWGGGGQSRQLSSIGAMGDGRKRQRSEAESDFMATGANAEKRHRGESERNNSRFDRGRGDDDDDDDDDKDCDMSLLTESRLRDNMNVDEEFNEHK